MKNKTRKMTREASGSHSSLFKPLVASSLALALGISVSVADTCPSGSTPSICYGTTAANQTLNTSESLLWSDIGISGINKPILPSYSITSPKPTSKIVENLVFKFTNDNPKNGASAEGTTQNYISNKGTSDQLSIDYQRYTISMGAGANKNVTNNDPGYQLPQATTLISSLKFDAGQKAIKLGDYGDGTVTVNFGDFTSNGKRAIVMNFNGSADARSFGNVAVPFAHGMSGTYSFVGNLAILSGDEALYDISFSDSVRGNITIYTNSFRNWSNYISGTQGRITFANNANLDGNLTSAVNGGDANTVKGGATVIFGTTADSTNRVMGDISFVQGTNTIEFKGDGIIDGTLAGRGSGYVEGSLPNADGSSHYVGIYATNNVTFGKNATIGNIVASGGNNNIVVEGDLVVNESIFATSGSKNTITINGSGHSIIGGILTSAFGESINTITFAPVVAGTPSVIDGDANTLTIKALNDTDIGQGYSIYTANGKNVVTIQAEGRDVILEAGTRASYGTISIDAQTLNIKSGGITANGDGSNIAENLFNIAGNATIAGNISARAGRATNTLVFGGASTITGGVAAIGSGTNNITFGSGSNEIVGRGVEQYGGVADGNGYSLLTYNGGKNYITLTGDRSSLVVDRLYHRYSGNRTQFDITGNNSTLTITSAIIDGGAGSGLNISFAGSNGTFQIGTNEIVPDPDTGDTGTTEDTVDGQTRAIVFTPGTLTNGANVSRGIINMSFADGGTIQGNLVSKSSSTTTITFNGTNDSYIPGRIKADGGTHRIAFHGTGTNAVQNGVVATGGGTNDITFNGTSSVQGLMNNVGDTVTGDWGYSLLTWSSATNRLNLEGDSSSLTIGNIYHRYGASRTEFNVTGNNSTLQLRDVAVDGGAGSGLNISFTGDSGTLQIGEDSGGQLTARQITNGANIDGAVTKIYFAHSGVIRGHIKTARGSSTSIIFDGGESASEVKDGNFRVESGTSNLTFNGGTSNTISSSIQTTGGTSNIRFNNGDANTITTFVKTTGGTTNIFFDGNGTNAIGSNTKGGIYSGSGTTNVTFSNGTDNTIAGKVQQEGGDDTTGYYAIVNNGGDINVKVNNASLTVNGVWQRLNGNRTRFTATGEDSVVNITGNFDIHGNNNYNKYASFDFVDGGSLTFSTALTLKNNNQAKPKVVFTFGGSGSIEGQINSERSDAQTIFNLGNSSEQDETIAQRELARKGSTNFSGGGQQTINFDGSNFTFLQQDASGSPASLSIGRSDITHTINFNAKNGIFNATSINVSNGANKINIANNASGTITGNIMASGSGSTTVTFSGTSTLTLQGVSNTLASIVASQTPEAVEGESVVRPVSTLIIDGSSAGNSTQVKDITNGENLVVHFAGGGDSAHTKTFQLTGMNAAQALSDGAEPAGQKIKTITFDDSSTYNTLDLTATNQKLTVEENIAVNDGRDLSIKLKNTALVLGGMTTTDGGNSVINVFGNTTDQSATIEGGIIQATTLNMTANTSEFASIIFNNAKSTFDNLIATKDGTTDGTYNLTLGANENRVTFKNAGVVAENGNITEATLDSVVFTSGGQTLEFGGGSAVINSIAAASTEDANSILELSSGTTFETANNTDVAVSGIQNGLHIKFTGGTDDQIHRSTLTLAGENNILASVTSEAKNAFIKLDGSTSTASVEIGSAITVTNGNSLVFSLVSGDGSDATATVTNGITVERGGTFGVSIGSGTGAKSINVGAGNNGAVDFQAGSTLLVDFLENASGTVALGNSQSQPIVIDAEDGVKSKSIINFWGNNTNASLAGGITIDGGDNTVNFLGNATLSGINFNSGTNTINVRDNGTNQGVTATINLADGNGSGSQLGRMTNIINLENNATLIVNDADNQTGSILSSGLGNTLNFIGDNAKLQGGFGVSDSVRTGGSATINVGYSDALQGLAIAEEVSGTITGQVTNADLAFNSKKSQLTLQGATNTFKSLTSNATDGLLYLNAQTTNVSAEIQGDITIGSGTSLTFGLISGNLPSSNNQASGGSTQGGVSTQAEASATGGQATLTTSGNIIVKGGGTLGIAIGGDGTNTRSVTLGSGKNITFDPNSTLRVDFLAGSQGSATLGDSNSKFTIGENRNSIINFYANSNATLAGGGLSLQGGTNTVNFYGNATLGQIELKSGKNYINVKNGVIATVENTGTPTLRVDSQSNINNVSNTINLGEGSTLKLNATTTDSGDGSILSALTNKLNFNGDSSTLEGGFGATGSGAAFINVGGTNSKITGNVTRSSITFTTSDADLTLQGDANTITALTGYTPEVSSYVRNGRVIKTSSQNTLTLSGNGVNGASATIMQSITGDSVALQFGSGEQSKTFTLSEGGNTLSGVLFNTGDDGNIASKVNTLAFAQGSNAITNAMTIGANTDLTIALGNREVVTEDEVLVSLNLVGGLSNEGNGTSGIAIQGKNTRAILSGGDVNTSSLTFGATESNYLAIQNAQATFGELNSSSSATLALDGSANEVNTTITALKTNSLTASFMGENGTTLTISGGDSASKEITLAGVSIADSSINNTLDLSSLTKTTVNSLIADNSQGLSINLGNTELTLAQGSEITEEAPSEELPSEVARATVPNVIYTINVDNTTATPPSVDASPGTRVSGGGAVLSGGDLVVTNLNMTGDDVATTLKSANTTITTLNAQGSTSNALTLDATSNAVSAVINNAISGVSGKELQVTLGGSTNKAELTLNNADGNTTILKSISLSGTSNVLSLANGTTTIADALSVDADEGLGINLSGTTELVNSTITNSGALAINTLDNANATITGVITANADTSIKMGNDSNTTITGAITIGASSNTTIDLESNARASFMDTISNGKTLNISLKESANANVANAVTTEADATTAIDLGSNAVMTIGGALAGVGTNNVTFQASSLPEVEETRNVAFNSLILGASEGNKITTLKAEDSSNAFLKGGDVEITTITLGENGVANLTLMNTNSTITTLSAATPTVAGRALEGEESTEESIAPASILSLDATNNAVNATIENKVTNGSNLALNFNGRGNKKEATLTLGAGGDFRTLSLASGSSANTLNLSETTTFADEVNLIRGASIAFNLNNNAELTFKKGLDGGTTTLNIDSGEAPTVGTREGDAITTVTATLSGDVIPSTPAQEGGSLAREMTAPSEEQLSNISITNMVMSGDNASKLVVKKANVTFNSLSAKAAQGSTLELDASGGNAVSVGINNGVSVAGANIPALAVSLKSGATAETSKEAKLTFKGRSNTIKSLDVVGTLNTLVLSQSSLVVQDELNIASGKSLQIDLEGGRLTTAETFTVGGNVDMNFLSGNAGINGAGLVVASGGTLNLNISSQVATALNTLDNKGTANLNFVGNNGTLYFDPTDASASLLTLSAITSEGSGNIVDIASSKIGSSYGVNYTRKDFRVLKIGDGTDADVSGNTLGFKVFVDKTRTDSNTIGGQVIGDDGQSASYGYAYSDRIIIDGQLKTPNTHNLLIIPKIDQLSQISYNGGGTEVANNVAVATIKKDSGITLATEDVINGFEIIQANLIAVDTDINGVAVASGDPSGKAVGDYTTYFLGSVKSKGISVEAQEVASTALSINYDLYMANLNSLNKRMGELRDNSHNQGVWARVFGGAQSSSFGIGSDTEYVTVQAGYDYDFDFSNAKNYLGVAFSYATSTSKSLSATQSIVNANASSNNMVGIDNINSNAYEVAVYNAYVSDSGWYNDTIAKFSYIDSTFSLANSANQSSTTNMAFTLSDEVGYRYKFAENEKGNWYIDPQLELSFGYLNQSDFNSVIASVSSSGFSNLNAFQDAVMTLRTRIGASLGKKFNTDKGFASLYVGAFYEYDYVAGGDSNVGVESGVSNTLNSLSSSGRAVLNVGSDIELTKGARLYIDVEKSFGDKFKTHMQFNVGTRYSF